MHLGSINCSKRRCSRFSPPKAYTRDICRQIGIQNIMAACLLRPIGVNNRAIRPVRFLNGVATCHAAERESREKCSRTIIRGLFDATADIDLLRVRSCFRRRRRPRQPSTLLLACPRPVAPIVCSVRVGRSFRAPAVFLHNSVNDGFARSRPLSTIQQTRHWCGIILI